MRPNSQRPIGPRRATPVVTPVAQRVSPVTGPNEHLSVPSASIVDPLTRRPLEVARERPRANRAPPTRLAVPSAEAARARDLPADERVAAADAPENDSSGVQQSGLFAYVVRRDRNGRLQLATAWPLWALLVPFPLWWALGLGSFIFPLIAIPMAVELWRRRPLRLPRGWWLWALFLVWTVLSLLMFSKNPTGTHAGTRSGRTISTLVALSEYGAATVTILFVGNLTRRELPIRTLVRWLGVLFLVTLAGGVLGTVAPHFGFTSPLEMILPKSLHIPYVKALVHPNAAQVQSLLGQGDNGRAAAPWGYTNFWANNLSLLLVWFVCGWGVRVRSGRRVACAVIVAVAVFPIAYSLNRGLWVGLGVSVLWIAIRLFLRGKVAALLAVFVALSLGAVVFTLTPLHSLFGDRIAHPQSNSIRTYLTQQAISGAEQSPLLGWGGTRKSNGSNNSIAIGQSSTCAQCGAFPIGSNGQLWAVLFNQGFVGGAFYFGFFAVCIWTYRRDRSPVGQAGVLVVALTFVYMLFYNSLPSSLTITMISVGLLWRSHDERAVDTGKSVLAPAIAS